MAAPYRKQNFLGMKTQHLQPVPGRPDTYRFVLDSKDQAMKSPEHCTTWDYDGKTTAHFTNVVKQCGYTGTLGVALTRWLNVFRAILLRNGFVSQR